MPLASGSVWWQAEKARKKIEEKKVQKPGQSKPKKIDLERAKAEAKRRYQPIIEREKEKAQKQFRQLIAQEKAEFLRQIQYRQKRVLKQTPMNIRSLMAKQLAVERAEALRQFEIQASQAEKQFLRQWEEERWKEIEKSLESSLEKAIASVPKGAEIKEVKFEEGAWKISYEVKQEQVTLPKTVKQPKTWTEQFAEWYSSAPIPGRMLKEALGDLFGVPKPVRQITEKSPVSRSIIGDVASFESFVKGIAHISVELTPPRFTPKEAGDLFKPIQIRAIEHPETFIEHRKWQMEMHELIGPSPPTLSGVAFSYALSPIFGAESAKVEYKRLMEWEKRYPGYIGGTVSADVLISLLLGETAGKVGGWIKQTKTYKELVRTVKFSRAYRFYYEKFKIPISAFYQTKIKLPVEKFLYKKSPWLYRRVFGKHVYYGLQAQLEWIDYEKPVAKGTAGLLEKAFGMPYFRSESLYRPMPTKEWTRVLYKEWLAPRLKIERQLTWELSLYPAFPVTTKGLELQKQMYSGGLLPSSEKIMQAERVKLPSGKTIYWTPRASLEFEQSVRGLMPNRLFIPKPPSGEKWFRVMRGKPTTPMSRTLERAMFGKLSMGGLSSELILTRPNILYQPPSPQTFYKGITKQFKTEPEIKLPNLPKIIRKSKPTLKTEKLLGSLISTVPSISTEAKTAIEVKAESITAQIQKTPMTLQTPTLKMKSRLITIETKEIEKAIEIPKFPSRLKPELKLPKPKMRKKKKPVGYYGWVGLEVPVPSAKQILKFVLGGRKK